MALQKYPLLTEEVVNLIIDQIHAFFNAYLADVDFQYKDGIALEAVAPNEVHISDAVQSLSLPAIYVLFEEHAFEYTQDPNYLETKDRCVVVLSCEGIGEQPTVRKAWRYARALNATLNLVDLHDAANRLKIRLMVNRIGYTKTVASKLGKSQGRFRKDCVIELQIHHYEKFVT